MSTIYTHLFKSRKNALFAFSLLVGLATYAQWSPIAAQTGNRGNDGAVSFNIGGLGYTIAGSSGGEVYMYDTLTDTWTLVDTAPINMGHAFAMSFMAGGRAFIVGGDTGGVSINTVWEYVPNGRGHWLQKQDFPGGRRDAGFGFGLDGFGYVGCGTDTGTLYGDIWRYDPQHDSWTHLSDTILPKVLIFPTSFVAGHKAYILTGGTAPGGVNELTDMICFDPATNTATSKASFPGSARQAAFAFSNSQYGYVGGGQAGYTTNYDDMWRYDAIHDRWDSAAGSPLLGGAWSSTFVIGNNAYAGLGAKFQGTGLTGNLNFFKFVMDEATATGIEATAGSDVSIYPNPASDFLTVQTGGEQVVEVEVYSAMGQKVISKTIRDKGNISIESLLSGMYYVKVRSGTYAGRLVQVIR